MMWRLDRDLRFPDDVGPTELTLQDLSEPLSETVLQRRLTEVLVNLDFVVNDFSQGRETQQTPGIPDLYVWQRGCPIGGTWLELKRPQVRRPSGRSKSGVLRWKIIQRLGKRSWEQEQWHIAALAADIRVATVDSTDLALAYLAHCGYRIPPEAYRAVWDLADQQRFYDPNAQPTPPRQYRKKGPRTTYGSRSMF